MKIRVTDIEWDCKDDATRAKLPKELELDVDDRLSDILADELTEATGYLVEDFSYEVAGPNK